jgi:hypothetical protein
VQPDAADAPGAELDEEIGLTHAGPDPRQLASAAKDRSAWP